MQKYILLILFIVLYQISMAQTKYEYCYWFDDNNEERQYGTSETSQLSLEIDVSGLTQGIHFFHYQVRDDLGNYSSPRSSVFMKMSEAVQSDSYTTRYWFDDDDAVVAEVPNGVFSLDVSGLSQGIHFFHYQVRDDIGNYSAPRSSIFMKSDVNIVRYEYWVNDDIENMYFKEADLKNVIFRTNDVIDVATYPIRPESFHFEVSDSIPYIYAKNELHARFYSSNGAWTEDSAEYADELSRKEVEPILLPRNSNERTDKTPEADSIRWYCLETKADNALSFRVSQPCTMQLFSPEGDELLNVSGEEVMDTINCYTPSDGMYYLAIHSVTGTDSLTTVSYLNNFVTFHKMTYVIDGKEYRTEIVAYGDSIVPLTPPDNENRPFSGWKGITEVMPGHDLTVEGGYEYKLRYVVEDSVWHEVSYYYGETIDDTYYADKEWYDFEEWEGMPETMPAQDVSVTAKFVFRLEMGDVNADERVSVTDVTVLTNHILKKPNTVFVHDAADMNGDGRISIVDVTMTTNKILDQ